MDDVRRAQIVLHLVLGRKLDPPLRPEEEDEVARLEAEIAAAKTANRVIRRRKLLLVISETVIITGIILVGSSLWPLARPGLAPVSLSGAELLRMIVTALTVALVCQAGMLFNRLYNWKGSQDLADLPNRMLQSMGYALMMLAIIAFAVTDLLRLPRLDGTLWKLMILLTVSFGAIYAWRAAFQWFSEPDRALQARENSAVSDQ